MTVLTLTVLMLIQGPTLCETVKGLVPERHRDRTTTVATDVARAVSHYMLGNVVISLIAGAAAFVVMLVLGVPNALLLALWIAFTDLIPLIGATLGALPAVLLAALHSGRDAIILAIFFLIYQQFENHVLQVVVMARAVQLNPLLVLMAVLVGVELLGFLGAFIAIPAAGAIQVVVHDVWDHRRGRPRDAPRESAPESDPAVPACTLPRWWRLPAPAARAIKRGRDRRTPASAADDAPHRRHDLVGRRARAEDRGDADVVRAAARRRRGRCRPTITGMSRPAARTASTMRAASVRWPPLCIDRPMASASSCSAAATIDSAVWRSPR